MIAFGLTSKTILRLQYVSFEWRNIVSLRSMSLSTQTGQWESYSQKVLHSGLAHPKQGSHVRNPLPSPGLCVISSELGPDFGFRLKLRLQSWRFTGGMTQLLKTCCWAAVFLPCEELATDHPMDQWPVLLGAGRSANGVFQNGVHSQSLSFQFVEHLMF